MEFITWAGIRSNRVNQLEPVPADVQYAGSAFYNGDGTVGFIYGYKDTGGSYRGTALYNAERPDLTTLFKNVSPDVPIWKLDTVYKIVLALNNYYGLGLEPTDFVDVLAPFDYTVLPQPLKITAKPDAMSCTGEIVLNVIQTLMTLSDIVVDRDADGVTDDYPLSSSVLVLEKRYYNFDFTPYRAVLQSIADPLDIPTLVNLLNSNDVKDECGNLSWDGGVLESSTFTYVYNGTTADYSLSNPSYKYVLAISCKSPNTNGGIILMHYDA